MRTDKKMSKSEWIRRIVRHHLTLPLKKRMEIIHGSPEVGIGFTRKIYRLKKGQRPPKSEHTFDRITITTT